jgi:hypothetical protein
MTNQERYRHIHVLISLAQDLLAKPPNKVGDLKSEWSQVFSKDVSMTASEANADNEARRAIIARHLDDAARLSTGENVPGFNDDDY